MTVRPRLLQAMMLVGLLTVGLAACGDPTKAELVDKSRGAESATALRDALGEPDEISKLGPIEKWTYKASDGSVVFMITGDKVIVETAN